MNTLREGLREYLDLRHSLGFKMREAGCCSSSSTSWKHARLNTSAMAWRSNGRNVLRCNPPSGPEDFALCAGLHVTAAPPTAAQRFRQ